MKEKRYTNLPYSMLKEQGTFLRGHFDFSQKGQFLFFITNYAKLNYDLEEIYKTIDNMDVISALSSELYKLKYYLLLADLTDTQKTIIDMLLKGCSFEYIAEELKLSIQNMHNNFNAVYKKVKFEIDKEDYDMCYTKAFKECSKCKSMLPANEEFFSPKKDSKDGLHSYCRKCRNTKKVS
jgi:DNA-binding CsgD family transcriptional regulator